MKQVGLLEAVQAGRILLVGTFLHFKKESIAYSDRKTGKPAVFDKIEYSILGANGVVFVQPDTRKMPGFDIAKFACPFKQGAKVVVDIERMEVDRGTTTISGTVELLEA